METETKTKELNPKQKLFCELYAEPGQFFGNGTQAYIEAYNVDVTKAGAYASARSCAYELLTNVDILTYIREVMELGPLNDETVDRELMFAIYQNADLGAKVKAIGEYNKVKSRIVTKLDHTSKGQAIGGTMTPEAEAILAKATGHATSTE